MGGGLSYRIWNVVQSFENEELEIIILSEKFWKFLI